jgi:hypothetical protein
MDMERTEMITDFEVEDDLLAFESGCGCDEIEAELSSEFSDLEVDEAPMLAAFENELEDDAAAELLGPDELDQAAFEAELAVASSELLSELEGEEELRAGDFADEIDLGMADLEAATDGDDSSLEDLIAVLKKYPGLKITLSC